MSASPSPAAACPVVHVSSAACASAASKPTTPPQGTGKRALVRSRQEDDLEPSIDDTLVGDHPGLDAERLARAAVDCYLAASRDLASHLTASDGRSRAQV